MKIKKALEKDIHIVTEVLKKTYHPELIILFGSAVREEFDEGSDLDFFIVKKTKLPRHRRATEVFYLIRGIEREYPVDFVIYTPEELDRRLKLGDFFVKNIFEEGKVLYENK